MNEDLKAQMQALIDQQIAHIKRQYGDKDNAEEGSDWARGELYGMMQMRDLVERWAQDLKLPIKRLPRPYYINTDGWLCLRDDDNVEHRLEKYE